MKRVPKQLVLRKISNLTGLVVIFSERKDNLGPSVFLSRNELLLVVFGLLRDGDVHRIQGNVHRIALFLCSDMLFNLRRIKFPYRFT